MVPLALLAALLGVLIATGVLTLKPQDGDGSNPFKGLLLGPAGVLLTGQDQVELQSEDGRVKVMAPPEFVDSPVILDYEESDLAGTTELPQGYVSTGRVFDLSARPADGGDDPVQFKSKLLITLFLGSNDLALFGGDYSRFSIQHFQEQTQLWDALPTVGDPESTTVTVHAGSLSRFALTVGPSGGKAGSELMAAAEPTETPPTPTPITPTPEPIEENLAKATPIPVLSNCSTNTIPVAGFGSNRRCDGNS